MRAVCVSLQYSRVLKPVCVKVNLRYSILQLLLTLDDGGGAGGCVDGETNFGADDGLTVRLEARPRQNHQGASYCEL